MAEEEIFTQRLDKIAQLKSKGINSYPTKFDITFTAEKILKEIPEGKVAAAGRIMTIRNMGKAAFFTIKDVTAKIQIYIKKDVVGEDNYKVFELLDIGDFIGVEGTVFKTKTGETTIKVEKFQLLSKSLRALPEKWHGLKDIETRYRQRYLDLISNNEVIEIFKKRASGITAIRSYLNQSGFIEVETPMMQSIPGGAAAKPFMTHHNALDIDLYLRIAPELYLKRLIVGGMERVYELGRTFRNEGISTRHNPEFTILEVYQAYADYNDMMTLCKNIMQETAKAIGITKVNFKDKEIDIFGEWKQLSIENAFSESGINFSDIFCEEKLKELGKKFEVEGYEKIPARKIFDHLFDKLVKPKLIEPTFVIDWPKFLCPLTKSKYEKPEIAERFELYIGCEELANAYSELNDPVEQKNRFEDQIKEREKGDDEAEFFDEDYVRALEHGMPPAGGLGIGIDRLIILLTQQESIKDVILFPLLKPLN
ncbi:MAG: lysine--tRNA ligase [Elusimicrobia bacterium RIFOXYD2_FULL_34_15]|nr:MAG: lysine--tRNA ligase [Elusimicrobia bacterium RIFOXYD2_FULL_34_15]